MIRHISLFAFEAQPVNGMTKEENIERVYRFLLEIPAMYPPMRACTVGKSCVPMPDIEGDKAPIFGDLVQICDYDTPEAAEGYAACEAHRKLQKLSGPMLKRVAAIDFVMPE